MNFVKFRDIRMYHDVEEGPGRGWTVEFTAHYPRYRPPRASVVARSPTGRTITDPQKISQIMPVEDWPEFARKTLTNNGEGNTDERLF